MTYQYDWVRDEPEHGRCCGGEPEAEEDAEVRHALLPHPQEATLLPRRSLLRLLNSVIICYYNDFIIMSSYMYSYLCERFDVVDCGDCGSLAPGQAQEGADRHHHRHHQQVQVVPAPFLKW